MCVSYLCSVVLTFDQSASVICFSPLAVCINMSFLHGRRMDHSSLWGRQIDERHTAATHRCLTLLRRSGPKAGTHGLYMHLLHFHSNNSTPDRCWGIWSQEIHLDPEGGANKKLEQPGFTPSTLFVTKLGCTFTSLHDFTSDELSSQAFSSAVSISLSWVRDMLPTSVPSHHTWEHSDCSDCSAWVGTLVTHLTPLACIAALTIQKLIKDHSDPLDSSDWATDTVLLHAPLHDWQAASFREGDSGGARPEIRLWVSPRGFKVPLQPMLAQTLFSYLSEFHSLLSFVSCYEYTYSANSLLGWTYAWLWCILQSRKLFH